MTDGTDRDKGVAIIAFLDQHEASCDPALIETVTYGTMLVLICRSCGAKAEASFDGAGRACLLHLRQLMQSHGALELTPPKDVQ